MSKLEQGGRIAFLLAFAFLFTHEMDAVFHAEWRILPVLSSFDDTSGRVAFTLLHVPIFAVLAYLFWEAPLQIARPARLIFAGFCALHVGLHWFFSGHPAYTFGSWDSDLLILGAGAFGAAYMLSRHLTATNAASGRN